MEKYTFPAGTLAVLESLQEPFAVYQFVNKRVVTLALSDGFCELFGYDDREQAYYDMDHDMYKLTHPDDASRIADAALRFATEGGKYEVIYRTRTPKNDGYRIIHAVGKHVLTDTGVRLAHVWYTDEGDYSEKHDVGHFVLNEALTNALHEESILKASHFDYLTGLPSMTYFFELADAGKKELLEKGQQPVMLVFDLNGMKFFNDKYGFAAGDQYLKDFGKLLSKTFSNENCSRFGQDHFAAYTQREGLEETLQKLFEESKALNGGNSLPVRAGAYPLQSENDSVGAACDRAKVACDAIRGTYESRYRIYDSTMRDAMLQKQYVLDNFEKALTENWICVYYQPIVRAVNGAVCDEEALARWIDPERGMLHPDEFIPALENAGLLYKLDLHVLDLVLDKMKRQEAAGYDIVPHSVNLSRSDFDACDIVEEIRKRVDAAGVPREKITVEITESVIGSDFDFIKSQIDRFRALGFPVWMDDFGSGYSTLDLLQSLKVDLLKFDMSFMKKLDEGDGGKIILTELMKMASALGVDTVCEGVETEDQVHFLQEIGCSKLQGFYFRKPVSPLELVEIYAKDDAIRYEDPRQSEYYELMGRVNLYDLAVIANAGDNSFRNFFDTLPMGIIEISGDSTRFVRSNQSYRDFVKRFLGFDLSHEGSSFAKYGDSFMNNVVKTCCEKGTRAFYDERMPNGTVVHSFARRISVNPVNGNVAVAVAVLAITEANEGTTYAGIARALASDYYYIYYVDLDTERYIEYSSPEGGEGLALERHGEDFFAAAKRDAMERVYDEDRGYFLKLFTKENIVAELEMQSAFTITYRLVDAGRPKFMNMKISYMLPERNKLIIGVSLIDAQMKQYEANERDRIEQMTQTTYTRVMALLGDYLTLYAVDPATGQYHEYTSSSDYESLGLAKQGDDFFTRGIEEAKRVLVPEDLPEFLEQFTKENVLKKLDETGVFQIKYRLMINGQPKAVCLRVASIMEKDGRKLIAGVRIWRERK